jgi:23S rRNA-/tRNA-specific pseudouridylate synthase
VFSKHRVVYLDKSLIVLNKPHGLIAQGTVQSDKKVRV